MRLEKVAVLAALFLGSAGFAQTGSAQTGSNAPDATSAAVPRIVRSTLPHAEGIPMPESGISTLPSAIPSLEPTIYAPSPRYFRFDFLYWEFTDPSQNGRILRTNSTDSSSFLIGNGFTTGSPNTDAEVGFRATFGKWVNDNVAFEIGGHWVHPYYYPVAFRADTRTSNSNGQTQTVTDSVSLTPDNEAALSIAVLLYEIRNSGVELNMRSLLLADAETGWTWESIFGFRYIQHDEIFHSFLQAQGGPEIREIFQTENSIVGPQFGLEARYNFHEFVAVKTGLKLGAAINAEDVNIGGPPVGTGRLTGINNLGSRNSVDFCPFVDFTVGLVFDLTPNLHVHAGFDAIYIDNVLRAMDQLDLRSVAARNVHYSFNRDSILMYGMWIGTEFNF